MPILSNRLINEVRRTCYRDHGMKPHVVDLTGAFVNTTDKLGALSAVRRKRDYALQECVTRGTPFLFHPAPGLSSWMFAIENRRMIHGGVMSPESLAGDDDQTGKDCLDHLVSQGMPPDAADSFVRKLEPRPEAELLNTAEAVQTTFYQLSGWQPELLEENRLKALQHEQINQAIQEQRASGKRPIYAFEKERVLLANIRAGDRNGARRMLNEMLTGIYMSSPSLTVLRARAIELMSYLTRAAIEDNPLMEPLIERNHAWTERLVKARDFEELSQKLMGSLDDFIDGIYLHGMNRSNTKVRKALDFIGTNFAGKISLQAVAAEAGVSACRLSHLVKQFTGRTVLQILHEVRVRHAQQMLERTDMSCTEIAYEVGFGDQSYFTKHFKRLTGTTPARYRRARHRANAHVAG